MTIAIRTIPPAELALYAQVPCAFTVDTRLVVEPIRGGLGGLRMREEPVVPPYVKDYDQEDTPVSWAEDFDVRAWGFFVALAGGRPVAGAAVAWRTPGVHMLAQRDDMAVLWDLRVHPDWRHQGLGERLFGHAADWSRAQGARLFKIETQNINVRACHFYRKQGCRLGAIDCDGYAGRPHLAHEVMLLWYLEL